MGVMRCSECGHLVDLSSFSWASLPFENCPRCKSGRMTWVFGRWYKSSTWYKPWTWLMPKCFVSAKMEKEGKYSPS